MSVVESVCRAKAFCTIDATSELETIRRQLQCRFMKEEVSKWRVVKCVSQFNRRMTCIEWHKEYPHMVAFGSYAGDIYLLDTMDSKKNHFIEGVGYGYGAITDMGFCPSRPLCMYATSLDGTFGIKDFEGRHGEIFLETMDFKYWWTSFDQTQDLLFVGGNTGKAVILDTDGKKLREYHRFHSGKIQCAQFCPASSNILVTSSNDKTVSLWDVRTWGEGTHPEPFTVLKHDAPINSAYFDPLYSSRILTTTQNSQLRVYSAHNWETPLLSMTHPHRNFQHITHIKATWHPFYDDLCVVGRYADAGDPDKTRCVDLIDLQHGTVAAQFYDPSASQIMTVNKLNKFGNMLASGMGSCALVWSITGLSCDKDSNKKTTSSSSNRIMLPKGSPQQRRGKKRKCDHLKEDCVKTKTIKKTKVVAKLKKKGQ